MRNFSNKISEIRFIHETEQSKRVFRLVVLMVINNILSLHPPFQDLQDLLVFVGLIAAFLILSRMAIHCGGDIIIYSDRFELKMAFQKYTFPIATIASNVILSDKQFIIKYDNITRAVDYTRIEIKCGKVKKVVKSNELDLKSIVDL